LYEAAVLDGAGRLKQTIHITLPAISPVIVIMFIFAVGGIVNDDFDQIYNLYNPAVYSVADVLSTYVYRAGLENMQYSFATAVGLFKNAVAFVLIIITNFISRKYSDYGLWNAWFDCLIYIRDGKKYVLQAILRKIIIDAAPQFSEMSVSIDNVSQPSAEELQIPQQFPNRESLCRECCE